MKNDPLNLNRSNHILGWFALLMVLVALPLVFGMTDYRDYLTYVWVRIMILALFAMSFDLIFGYAGMLSLGHALFHGGAAYVIAIVTVQLDLGLHDATLPILIALVSGLVFGWIQGFLSCRLGHLSIFLVTFATAESMFLIILADPFNITNSENGIAGIPRETFLGVLDIKSETRFYYFVLIILGLSLFALKAIIRMPFGDILQAIRENPQRAKFLGFKVKQYRVAAFMISGLFASLAGSLTALHEKSVGPEMFTVVESSFPFLFTMLGGAGTLLGPILGTTIMVILIEIISEYVTYYMLVVAIIIVLLILFLPGGFLSLLQKVQQDNRLHNGFFNIRKNAVLRGLFSKTENK